MIVCDEKLMEYANYLMALIGQNDDVDGDVVGTKDGMVTAAIYTPKNYKDTLPKITSNTHILFIGSFKEAKEQEKNVDFKLDKYGMRYGWLGKNSEEYARRKQIVKNYLDGKNLEKDDDYIATWGIAKRTLEDIICIGDAYATEARESALNNTPSRESIVNNNITLLSVEGNGFKYEKNMRTITTKQDRDPCAGLVEYPNDIEGKLNYRYLTPRECFLGMGFDNEDYQILINNNFKVNRGNMFFNASKIYKMAGNSIVVNILEAVSMQIFEIKDLLED